MAGKDRWEFPSGAIVRIGYCKEPEDVGGYQGGEWSYIGYDEIGNLQEEAVWDLLLAEMRSPDPSIISMARASANPGGKGHAWVKRRFIVPTDHGRKVFHVEHSLPDGRVHRSTRVFIPSRVTDNPIYANDVRYMAVLNALPDVLRRQLRDGDWDAGEGMALDELTRAIHMPIGWRPSVPNHWYVWAAFDWGFGHPWAFTVGAQSPHGRCVILDTIMGWRQRPDEIVARIVEHAESLFPTIGVKRYQQIVAGRDCFYETAARNTKGDTTPTIASHFATAGMWMVEANDKRVFGLTNLRQYFAWRNVKPPEPRLTIADTPGNHLLFDTLERMVTDPRRREDALKTDADPRTGEGGDDAYDALRYLMAAWPYQPKEPAENRANDPNVDPMDPVFHELVNPTDPHAGHGSWDQLPQGY